MNSHGSEGPLNLNSSPPPELTTSGHPVGRMGRTHPSYHHQGSHNNSSTHSSSEPIYNSRLAASLPVESRFGAATTRFTSDVVTFLARIGNRLPDRWQPYFWPGIWFGFVVLVIVIFAVFHSNIYAALEGVATFIKNLGPLGPFMLMAAMFVVSFPPLIGYSSIVTMSGEKGNMLRVFSDHGTKSQGLSLAFTAVEDGSKPKQEILSTGTKASKALSGQLRNEVSRLMFMSFCFFLVGIEKLLLMIRLAPYPYNILNLALSLTHIPISTFAAATALSLLKLSLHVYIGSTLSTLTSTPPPNDGGEPAPDPNAGSKPLRIFVLVTGIIVGVIVGGYVGLLAKREIDQNEYARLERLRRKRTRRRRNRDRGGSDAFGGGTDAFGGESRENEEHIPSVDLTNQWTGGGNGSSDYVGANFLNDEEEDENEHQTLFQQNRVNPWDRDNNYDNEDNESDDGSGSDSEDSVLFDEDDEFEDDEEVDLERGTGLPTEFGLDSQNPFASDRHGLLFGGRDDEDSQGVDISDRR
ncbi:hypothetical protein BG004_006126 [Podila humilis]|nr:hypothetical protein BG004_006126 [Podila humilis]